MADNDDQSQHRVKGGASMERRIELKEPPREGQPKSARYWLRDGLSDLVGWTNSRREAIQWRDGFGPGAQVSVEDTRLHEVLVHQG
jgi:hypothetical protein